MHDETRLCQRSLSMLVLAVTLVLGQPAFGCWNADPSAPADSPSWWTLSDDIEPEELRRRCLDVEEHQLRYLEALQLDPSAELPPAIQDLVFFVDGSRTPELVPAWRAFSSFAGDLATWPDQARDGAVRELADRGVSLATILRVLELADQRNLRARMLSDELDPHFMRLEELSAKARQEGRYVDFRSAAKAGNVAALSAQTGVDPQVIELGLKARRSRPEEVSSVEAMVALRASVDPADWAALRKFLIERVAVGLRGIGFEKGAGQ